VLYVPFPKSHAGTTYQVHKVTDGPGVVDENTKSSSIITTAMCLKARSKSRSKTLAA